MPIMTMIVNGTGRSAEVEGRTLLLQFLRDLLRLTEAQVGCDTSQCGACTVLVNGEAIKFCTEAALTTKFSRELLTDMKFDADGLSSDIHASAEYRAHIISVVARRAVTTTLERSLA